MAAWTRTPLGAPSILRDEAGQMATSRPWDQSAVWLRGSQRGPSEGVRTQELDPSFTASQNSHPFLQTSNCRARAWAWNTGKPGFTVQLHLFLVA